MSLPEPPPRRSFGGAILHSGPNWIIAIGTLLAAIAAAGFIGHATATPKAEPRPAVTVTATTTVTAPPPTGDPSTTPGPSGTDGPATPGQLITTYSFHLPGRYGAPLGTKAPTQAQIVASSPADIIYRSDLGGAPIVPAQGNQMFQLTNGTTPTYQACTTTTNVTQGLSVVTGTVFCVTEASGYVAGVKVTSAHQVNDGNPWSLDLTVWIWRNV